MNFSGTMLASYICLWVIVIIQMLVILEVLRQIGILRLRIGDDPGALLVEGEGLDRGELAPEFAARDLNSGKIISNAIFREHMTLLVFLTTRCEACRNLAPSLVRAAREHERDAKIVIVCSGPGDECTMFAREFGLSMPVVVDQDQQIFTAYRIRRTPIALLVDNDGRARIQGIANDGQQLEGLFREEATLPQSQR